MNRNFQIGRLLPANAQKIKCKINLKIWDRIENKTDQE